jgi:hypothetical protein
MAEKNPTAEFAVWKTHLKRTIFEFLGLECIFAWMDHDDEFYMNCIKN